MWRFYAIATVIVVVAGSIVFAHRLATKGWTLHPDTKSSRAPVSGNGNNGFVTTPPPSFVGEGGWVLSALPGCFIQQSAKLGPSSVLAHDIPPPSARIAPGTTLRRGPCVVQVRDDDIWVVRGKDRLRVPPLAELFTTGGGLTLVYRHGDETEIRVY
ncbi:MAG TPA: hypothetical protein VFE70_08580 [Candidatus Elarobacter sp.]|nr:hypothetical protein [Candidatus Elarobacter sp.]